MNNLSPKEFPGHIIIIFLSVALITLSFPPFSVPFSGMVGLGLFFHVLFKTGSIRQSCWSGFIFGVFFAISAGRGIMYASLVHYGKSPLFAVLFFIFSAAIPSGFLFSLFSILFRFLNNRGILFRCLAIPSMWTLFEYLREIIPGSIPWANMGYTMIACLPYVQMADIFGVYGISFIIALSSSLGQWVLEGCTISRTNSHKFFTKQIAKPLILLSIVICLPFIYGVLRISQIESTVKNSGKPLFSACIQGGFSPSDRWKGLEFFGRLSTYEAMTKDALKDATYPCLIVWPESVLNIHNSKSDVIFDDISEMIGKESVLVSGGTKKQKEGLNNSAYIITGRGSVSAYDKNILLPFAEKSLFSFKLGSFQGAPDEFLKGRTKPFINAGGLDLGLSICLEDLYPWYIRKSVNHGAGLLVNISADDWFGKTGTSEMHLDASRMRAIENRRFIIRCANSGVSAIISATGGIEEKTRPFERESIKGRSYIIYNKSIYTRTGDAVIFFSALILIISFSGIIFSRNENSRI